MSYKRRNYPRVSLKEPVTVMVTINDRALHNAKADNISMGGMCITVSDKVEAQQKGSVEIMHECDNEMLSFKAEFSIQWIIPGDDNNDSMKFGIKFTYYDANDLQKIARIIIDQIRKNSKENVEA